MQSVVVCAFVCIYHMLRLQGTVVQLLYCMKCPSALHTYVHVEYVNNDVHIKQYSRLLRDGGGWLYPVIQRKSSASVVQGLKPANRTGKEKVQTTHQTALTVLPRECATVHGKHPRCFTFLYFSSNSTSSSSLGALAHE